jgi:hypothetical protein
VALLAFSGAQRCARHRVKSAGIESRGRGIQWCTSLLNRSRRCQRFALLDNERGQYLARRLLRTLCPMALSSRDQEDVTRLHRHSRRALQVLGKSTVEHVGQNVTGMCVFRFSGTRREFHLGKRGMSFGPPSAANPLTHGTPSAAFRSTVCQKPLVAASATAWFYRSRTGPFSGVKSSRFRHVWLPRAFPCSNRRGFASRRKPELALYDSISLWLWLEMLIHPDPKRASRRTCLVSARLPIRLASSPTLRANMATLLIIAPEGNTWYS